MTSSSLKHPIKLTGDSSRKGHRIKAENTESVNDSANGNYNEGGHAGSEGL